jgi:tetratricopeptide (TPR) repeat protein
VSEGKIFVGRKAELEQFKKVLEDPEGQAVLVVGHRGMGKTWLVDKMAETAKNHPDLECGCVRYEVTPTDSVDSTMALMIDNAFEAAQIKDGSFSGTARRLEQWRSLLNVVNLGDLILSLRRDPSKNTCEQFLERLQLISKRMPENGRAIFIIDPEKRIQKESDYAWGIVISRLPSKVKFLFAQRVEDELVCGEGLERCNNVVRIPEGELSKFDDETADELVNITMSERVGVSDAVKVQIINSDRKPYTIGGAANLLAHTTIQLKDLARYLTEEEIVGAQWRGVCSKGENAKRLFEAHAILEVGVPVDVVQNVSGLDNTDRRLLEEDTYLQGLLREEGYGKRIYHAILADYILEHISDVDAKMYHARAVDVYRNRIKDAAEKQVKPDALAAIRLAEHVLAAEGEEAFVLTFTNECFPQLKTLGMLDTTISLSRRALDVVQRGSEGEAVVKGNLGIIYCQLGRYEESKKLHKEALNINEKLGRSIGAAIQRVGLGLVYYECDELDTAEKLLQEALAISEELKDKTGIASAHGNLCLVFAKQGKYNLVEEHVRKAIEIAQEIEDYKTVTSCLVHIGILYGKGHEFEKVERIFFVALEFFSEQSDTEGVAIVHGNLGVLYKKWVQPNKAKEHWEKALELYKQMGVEHQVTKLREWIDDLDKGSDL